MGILVSNLSNSERNPVNVKKKIVILGSTGSIGTNALWVAGNLADEIEVVGLAAGGRWETLAAQVRDFDVPHAVIGAEKHLTSLRNSVPAACSVSAGPQGLIDLASRPDVDTVVCAITGVGGLEPVIAAIREGKEIALASKEVLVTAGALVTKLAAQHGVRILPIDSEHSAIFQCLQGCRIEEVRRLILTASGGPFRDKPAATIKNATYHEALAHPTWDMGPKITIDSATMMNKALELIEACWLFNLPHKMIDVVVHPQSIIHSMIELVDSGLLAQLGTPDMRLPIQYALTYPERRPADLPRCKLEELGSLSFHPLDNNRFPSINLARRALDMGGTAPAVLNAANEVAVELFSQDKIRLPDIWRLVEQALDAHTPAPADDLETILATDRKAREQTAALA